MLSSFVLLLLHLYCFCFANGIVEQQTTKTRLPFSMKELRESMNAKDMIKMTSDFSHMSELSSALKSNSIEFNVFESLNSPDGHDLSKSALAFYNTTTKYRLYDEAHYFNIDDIHVSSIREIGTNHVKYCGDSDSSDTLVGVRDIAKKAQEGTFFIVGSKEGQWHRSLKQYTGIKSLNLVRKVKSYSFEESSKCHLLNTESILPLELFSKMRIETEGNVPYQTTYSANNEDDNRKLGANDDMNITPTSPLVDCANSLWGTGYVFQGANADKTFNYTYKLGGFIGCAQFTMKLPGSFNYNYDYTSKKAKQALDFGSGIACSNCFAFMGAGLLGIIEYTGTDLFGNPWYGPLVGSHFYIEAKAQGGAGVNLDIAITDPASTATKTVQLFPAAPSSSYTFVNLGSSGFKLGYKNGGMKVTLKFNPINPNPNPNRRQK